MRDQLGELFVCSCCYYSNIKELDRPVRQQNWRDRKRAQFSKYLTGLLLSTMSSLPFLPQITPPGG